MRVTVDTNVLLSGILFGGPPGEILQAASQRVFTLVLSRPIIEELSEVMKRPKFGLLPEAVDMLVSDVESMCELVRPKTRYEVVAADPDDNVIVECAAEAAASFIVSGDDHLLGLGSVAGIPVLSPARFAGKLRLGPQNPDPS